MSRCGGYRTSVVVLAAVLLAAPALAQTPSGPPNALQGFSQNRDKPVKIDAAALEVRDKDKTATFSGNVQVIQGDTTMRARSLVVFYDGDSGGAGNTLTAAKPGPRGSQRIRRLEARGGVKVTQKDQVATGETGIFDMAANTVTLNGGVVISQGQNVIEGDRLIVDLTSGVSRIEAGKSGQGRVRGLFLPSSMPNGKPDGDKTDKTGKEAPKARAARPSSTN
jgi:lipopolysaccharide export system protein LptA